MSNDLLWIAAQVAKPDMRTALLARAGDEYDERDWTDQGTGAGETVVLDTQAALAHDRWALSAKHGDPVLEPADYWRCRRWVIADAMRDRHPLVPFDPTAHAVADIAARHGVRAAIDFLKDAWTHQQVLALHDFFFHFHSLLRSEAWGIARQDALHELAFGRASDAKTLQDRARLLASEDAAKGRPVAPLEAVLEREHAEALARLQAARRQRYADFLRSASAIRPVFYALRDLYWELHFLAGEDDAGPFVERERLVDEWQADMFQVLLRPYGEMVQVSLPDGQSEREVRRHLAFWTRGRVQLNEEMEDLALRAFRASGIDAMIVDLDAAIRSALDATQVAALQAFDQLVQG